MDAEAARGYLRLILNWWWLLLLGAVIPAAISYHFVSQEPDVYQAKATLIVGRSVFQDPDPNTREMNLSSTLAVAYAEIIRQRSVLEPVIEMLELSRTPEELASQIGTNVRSGAQLLEISVTDTNPQAAALIANALADELVRRSPTSEENTPEQQSFVEAQLKEMETKIEGLTEEIDELTTRLGELTSAAEIQEAQERVDALEQVKSRYQTTYADLLAVSRTESPNEVSIFEPATVPEWPIPSRTKLIVAIAGVAGIGLAVGAVLLMEYMDTSLRWEDSDPHSILDLPVLAAIPPISKRGILSPDDRLSPAAEGIRAMRSRLYLMRPNSYFKTLLVTSPGSSEGKSFIVSNLAMVLASGGHRVILIDADMRRPSLHELFDCPNIVGLSDVLGNPNFHSGNAASGIPLQKTDFDDLFLLSSGSSPLDPAALLTSSRFPNLLKNLEAQGDIVLIDSPPTLNAPDATIIATHVEGTILVVNTGITSRSAGRQAKEQLLSQQGVNLLGLAVNHVKASEGYHYYYTQEQETKKLWWGRWKEDGADGTVTLAGAASRLGISKEQARRWCKSGRLSATRKWLLWWQVDKAALDRVIADTVGEVDETVDPANGPFSEGR